MDIKKFTAIFIVFILSTSILIAYSKYRERKAREEMELDLNTSVNLIESHLQSHKFNYTSANWASHWEYLDQKVDENDSRVAINRAIVLTDKLRQLNVSKDEIEEVDRCLNETYYFYNIGKFYDTLTQARVCAILASNYLGSHLVVANRTEFYDYVSEGIQNVTIIKNEAEKEWKNRIKSGVEFTDYMVTGFKIEDNLVEASFFINNSLTFLEQLKKEPDPISPEDAENLTLIGGRITSNLEYARSFLEDALMLMEHVNSGDFQPVELESEMKMLRKNLSEVDRPCNIPMSMTKVACDWKDYHKERGIIALQKGYYSAANYHLLYAIAIAERLDEFKTLEFEFNSSKSLTDKTNVILRLREEAINSLKECPSDPITSLYLNDATGWYFKRAEHVLRDSIDPEVYYSVYRSHDYDSHIIYDYEMTKALAKKFCPYLDLMKNKNR